ncbi:MAG: hypothetical protein Q8M73_03380 [Actinomycetota bacterium]|nr:hypothetical protein [Actinomycetota bacterium]
MNLVTHEAAVPAKALIQPTLMLTGRSAATVYAQPGAELSRLAKSGAIIKIARGYYAAIPVDKRKGDWLPSLETLTAGLATAIYGPGHGALWGLSAARVHGALPRALATGFALGPNQHRAIALTVRQGKVEFRKRDPERLELEYLTTELGPGLVTSIEQTILDLSVRAFSDESEPRVEAVRNLMALANPDRLDEVATRVRGRAALARANRLVADAH